MHREVLVRGLRATRILVLRHRRDTRAKVSAGRRCETHRPIRDCDFEVVASEKKAKRALQRPIHSLWTLHRAGTQRLLRRFPNRIQIEWLPAYAPDLNPVEQVWNRAQYTDWAHYIPDDVLALGHEVARSIRQTRSQKTLLHSFFRHCGLRL